MTHPLAVFVPVVGQASETFLRRHVEELVPGGTVVVARRPAPSGPGGWQVDAPVLWVDELQAEWGGVREQDAVAAFLAEHGVRAVLAEYLDIWLPFLPVFERAGVRCIAHAHGYDVSLRLRDEHWRRAYLAYQNVHAVVTMSQFSRVRLEKLGLPAERLHVVPYGVDVPPRSLHLPREVVHVVAVGRLVAKKAPLVMLEACRLAATSGASLRLSVIGDGPLMGAMRAAAAHAAFPVDLRGAGGHDEVLRVMADADVFCQHSVTDPDTGDEEGLPVAILEAMAHGLPVLSTRHAGIPEAVQDGVTGLLVEEGDVEGMAELIVSLAADPALRRRLGSAGRHRVEQHFSAAAERRSLLDLLAIADDRMPVMQQESP